MTLTITLPDEDVQALNARAPARGVSAEQYALEVLEHDLAGAEARPARFENLSDLLLSSPSREPTSTWSDPNWMTDFLIDQRALA